MLQLIGLSLRKKHWYQSLVKLQSVWTRLWRVFYFGGGSSFCRFIFCQMSPYKTFRGFSPRRRTVQWFDNQSGWAGLTPRRQQTTQPPPTTPLLQWLRELFILNIETSSAPIQDFITLYAKGCTWKVSSRTASEASKSGGFMKSGC